MLEQYTWLFGITVVAAFFDAYGIGANDVSNSFSTSVASGSLSLAQACGIAVFTEFLGAYLLGADTANTFKDGIIDVKLFADKPELLMLAMFCALVGSATWTMVATRLGWPVSTTHAIVGAVVGVGISGFGLNSVKWGYDGIAKIVTSWFASPVISACVASFIFLVTKYAVLKHRNSFERGLIAIPIYFGVTSLIDIFYILFKNGKGPGGLPILYLVLIVLAVSICVMILCWLFFNPWIKRKVKGGEDLKFYHVFVTPFLSERPKRADKSEEAGVVEEVEKELGFWGKVKKKIFHGVNVDVTKVESNHLQNVHDAAEVYDEDTEYMYSFLQVITACMASFAHGSNDVANAIGPLAVVYNVWKSGEVDVSGKTSVPVWVLVFGGLAIDIGLVTYGYNIMRSLGTNITFQSPSRGFSIELGTSLTVLTASKIGVPVSTTHCITGATAGVGCCNGSLKAVNWKMIGWCFFSWFLTLPASALTSGLIFAFASRAPSLI
jgi:sodium-dependent phosphate transporter